MPASVKLLGLAALHAAGRRTIGIFLDPVLGCNLRCRMCYFSDPAHRSAAKGKISDEQLERLEKWLMPRAAKLQIGCGAEPTLYPDLKKIVEAGKRSGVPYISLTTNGMVPARRPGMLLELVESGLDELTLSLHGTRRETYEHLMDGASFDLFKKLTEIIADVKKKYPGFKLRVNFTVNSMNVDDLRDERFWNLWAEGGIPDIIQLRPVQNIGNSDWTDFDLNPIKEAYDDTIGRIAVEAGKRNITCIVPSREQIDEVATPQSEASSAIAEFTYCYVSPDECYNPNFQTDDTYTSYHRRNHSVRRLIKTAFTSKKRKKAKKVSKKLNYSVK